MKKPCQRLGVTVTELLVVLAIMGMLMGLLLPAIQKARAAAAKSECSNNLRQIALAAQQFHDTTGTFPAGMRFQYGTDAQLMSSWLTQLLPYLEQDALWRATQQAYQ